MNACVKKNRRNSTITSFYSLLYSSYWRLKIHNLIIHLLRWKESKWTRTSECLDDCVRDSSIESFARDCTVCTCRFHIAANDLPFARNWRLATACNYNDCCASFARNCIYVMKTWLWFLLQLQSWVWLHSATVAKLSVTKSCCSREAECD